MSYRWLTELAGWLRADPVLAPRVIEWAGWQSRGRPPSDFSYDPDGVLDHHTACMGRYGHDAQSCINGLLAGNSSAPPPISQLLVCWAPPGVKWQGHNTDPRVVVIAAGRANHAGDCVLPWNGSTSGNGTTVGIEVCGPPETEGRWQPLVLEVRARVTAAVLRGLGQPASHCTTHYECAVPLGRKIDPSGAWPPQPTLGVTQPWAPPLWRDYMAPFIANPWPPEPEPEPPIPPDPVPPPNDPPLPPLETDDTMEILQQGTRVLDTRDTSGALEPNETRDVALHAAGAQAAMVNITAVNPAGKGFLTAWGAGARPNTSCLQVTPGVNISNAVVVPIEGDEIHIYSSVGTDLLVDVQAFWP